MSIEAAIANLLLAAGENTVREDAVVIHAVDAVYPRPTAAEVRDVIGRMELVGRLTGITDDFNQKKRLRLSADGKAWALAHQ